MECTFMDGITRHMTMSLILRFIHLLQLSVFEPISPFTIVLVAYT